MSLQTLRPVECTLSNGLRVAALRLPHVHRTAVCATIRVGSRFETRKTNGISHFLEHMLYRGIPAFPSASALSLAFEELGGSLSATTASDIGTLSVTVPTENLNPIIRLFSEVFQNPVFDSIETEKGIVREELLEELDERGRVVDADTIVRQEAFGDHPLGYPLGGTIEHLETFGPSLLKSHHRKHYCGQRTSIAVVGPVDPEKVVARLENGFSSVSRGETTRAAPPPAQRQPRFKYVKHASSQTTVRLGFRAPGLRDIREPATDLLMRIIDDGMSTRLYRRICEDLGLCYDVGAAYETYADSGFVALSAETAHDRVERVLIELFAMTRSLGDDGPTEAEVIKAKARHRWQLEEWLDDPDDLAEHLAAERLLGRPKSLAERRDEIDAVSLADVHDAATSLFAETRRTTVIVGTPSKRVRERLERAALG